MFPSKHAEFASLDSLHRLLSLIWGAMYNLEVVMYYSQLLRSNVARC